jgi:hypothetical protein
MTHRSPFVIAAVALMVTACGGGPDSGAGPASTSRSSGTVVAFDIHRSLPSEDEAALHAVSAQVDDEPANLTAGDTMGAAPPKWVGFRDGATRATYLKQLDQAKAAARRYASARAAAADGYVLASYFISAFGVHWVKWSLVTKPFDPAHPAMLLYDGDGTDAHLLGLSYYTESSPGPPAGFAGDNDLWHRHFGDCYAGGFVVGEDIADAATCAKIGDARAEGQVHQPVGTPAEAGDIQRYLASHPGPPDPPTFDSVLVGGANVWMLHLWISSNPNGVFSTSNPTVTRCRGVCRTPTT